MVIQEGVLRETDKSEITLARVHVDEMFAHAMRVLPEECCGLVGGLNNTSRNVYPLRNTARDPRVRYEARPEELFAAQKTMRVRGEELLAIYHSHPRAAEPEPSETDVRLSYYPEVGYLIIGFEDQHPVLRGFRINAEENSWRPAKFRIL